MSENISDLMDDALERMTKRLHSMTPEEKAEIERQRIESEAFYRKNQLDNVRSGWNAPERHLKRKDVDRTGAWGTKEAELEKMLGKGFLVALVGGRGPGKTQMGVELMKKTTESLHRAYYDTLTGLFLRIKATFKKDSRNTEDDVVREMTQPSLLVLDEISRRSDSDWENRVLYEIIDHRYREMNDTLLIANQTKEQFIEAIGESLASRMQETGGIIECTWQSYRL